MKLKNFVIFAVLALVAMLGISFAPAPPVEAKTNDALETGSILKPSVTVELRAKVSLKEKFSAGDLESVSSLETENRQAVSNDAGTVSVSADNVSENTVSENAASEAFTDRRRHSAMRSDNAAGEKMNETEPEENFYLENLYFETPPDEQTGSNIFSAVRAVAPNESLSRASPVIA